MAKKEYKVWLDIYKDNIVIAPYELQTYKYVKPFFSRGDMYGNIFYIEIQKNGTKYNLTTENVTVQYYIDGQCTPMYTQVESSLLRIEDGAIVLELDPAVFAFVGDVHAQVLISNGSEKISCPDISFEVQRGSADYLPADNVYQVVVVYLTQAEYDVKQAAGTLESGKLYIITDEVGTPYYQIYHNSLTGLQGGASNEQFHLTQAQHTAITSIEKVIKIGNDGVATAANTVDITTPSYGIATGTNDYAIILDPAPEAYVAGMMVSFFAQNSNDSDCTLNINGLGIKPIKKNIDQEIPFNSIKAGQIVTVLYDGTNFQLISGSGSGGIAIPLYSTNTLSVESNTVTIGIDFFDKNKDILLVYQNSAFISVGNDYVVSEDNLTIEKVSGTWESGTIIDFVCFQMVDANPDVLGITKIESSFTATADNTTHIPMNTSNYNPANDVLYVYYQNLLIFENLDYTVNVDGVSIDLIGFDIDTDEVINFQILKKVRQSLDTTDGTLIQDGTVGNAKLATDIKVGSLASLTTDNKSTVVDAINEVDANLNLVDTTVASHLAKSSHLGLNACVKVSRSVTQSIANSANVTLSFDVDIFNDYGMHNVASQNSMIVCTQTGKYIIGVNVRWAANATGYRLLQIRKNGSITVASDVKDFTASVGIDTQNLDTMVDLNVGDYIEVMARQNSGGALDILKSTDYSPMLWAAKVG